MLISVSDKGVLLLYFRRNNTIAVYLSTSHLKPAPVTRLSLSELGQMDVAKPLVRLLTAKINIGLG